MTIKPKTLIQRMQKLEAVHIALKYEVHQLKSQVKKIGNLKTIINNCNIQIKSYENREGNSERMYNTTLLRMREIHKDYISLFKKWGTTITFFEKRIAGEDWIPGNPPDEEEDESLPKKSTNYTLRSRGRPSAHSITPFNRKDK